MTTVRLVSEALSALVLTLEAGVPAGVPAAVEPAAAVSAAESTTGEGERPVLANEPAAASKECWVLDPVVGPKVKLRKLSVGLTAAAASEPLAA